jgi:septal ring factor EnvC (AmiA/AmiB activator)
VTEVRTEGGDKRMKKVVSYLALLALLSTPFLSACGTDKLQQDIEGLKKQIESLSSEKAQLESQVKEAMAKGSELSAKVDELAKANEELKAKVDELSKITQELKAKSEKKAPAKAKAAPKKK